MRARVQSRGGWIADVLSCGFCFSHHAAAAAVVLLVLHYAAAARGWIVDPGLLLLIWLASTRLSNLCNDITYNRCRTPGRDVQTFLIEESDLDNDQQ